MREGSTPSSSNRATRLFMAKDFPVPGPAITRKGLSFVAAMFLAIPAKPSSQGML